MLVLRDWIEPVKGIQGLQRKFELDLEGFSTSLRVVHLCHSREDASSTDQPVLKGAPQSFFGCDISLWCSFLSFELLL
jgi:hypothetical protein